MHTRFIVGMLVLAFLFGAVQESSSCGDCAVYSCYCANRPAWLDQTQTSSDGNYIIWYTDNAHHNAPFVGGLDSDGDTLPDAWESNYWGNLTFNQADDPDADGDNNATEWAAGSWPDEALFRRRDPIDAGVDGAGNNVIAQDLIDTLMFCQGRYAAWGFNAPWGLPLTVFIRYTDFGGWGNVNPLWIGSHRYAQILADPDRRSTAIHELFHNVQRAYPDLPSDSDWFIEGSARMSQDFFYLDQDQLPNSRYCGEVRGFLANPEGASLFERSYNAVFFWKYLVEQTGGAIVGQPFARFDAMDAFMRAARGLETAEAVEAHLDGLDADAYWRGARFDRFYGAWITALYARQFEAASLDPIYYFEDEQENLPSSRERPVNIVNCAYNDAANTYTPEALPAANVVAYNDTNTTTWSVRLDPWRSRYYAFRPNAGTRIVLVQVDGKPGQRNYYSLVTSRTNHVRHVVFQYGEDLLRAFYNEPLGEIGVVIGALDQAAEYDLMVWTLQEFGLQIRHPTAGSTALVRLYDDGRRSPLPVRVRVAASKPRVGTSIVAGLPPEVFEVTVNSLTSRVTAAYLVGEEYHLLCDAPDLPEGLYDLQVRLFDQGDSETDAVEYREAPHVDRMIVVDRSGSMGSELMGNNEKMMAAKMGALFYTDLMAEGDMLGLASFGSTGRLDERLTVMDGLFGPNRQAMKTAIHTKIPSDVVATEHTAMGQGITNAYAQLASRGRAEDDWRMALLTDGIEDRPPFWAEASVSGVVVASKVKIDAVAIGQGAHEGRLLGIAQQTEGDYYHIPVPVTESALRAAGGVDPVVQVKSANVYRQINERDLGLTRIWSLEGSAVMTASNLPFLVYDGMRNLRLTLSWPSGGYLSTELVNPSGHNVYPSTSDSGHQIYDLPDTPGTWTLRVSASYPTPYLAVLTGIGPLQAHLFVTHPEGSTSAGAVQRIGFVLTGKNGAPVTDASVRATIATPAGHLEHLDLFDNADHGDTAAGDGVYSRDFRWTPWAGTYGVQVVAEGLYRGDPYRMEQNGFFLIDGYIQERDPDKDGMPSDWEIRYGLKPNVHDAGDDLDDDGISNLDEFLLGCNPANEDTDGGGTPDGVERGKGMNPRDATDDRAAPPLLFYANRQATDAYDPDYYAPRSGENALYWSKNANYSAVIISRATNPSGPFLRLFRSYPADQRPYVDVGLVNGTTYYYIIEAVTRDGVMSRRSEILAATPKADNTAPIGQVDIVSASGTVSSLHVTLRLAASPDTTSMRFSNTARFEGSAWIPFADTAAWTLAGARGANFVYAQFRDAAGNVSLPVCDGVQYTEVFGWTWNDWLGWHYNLGGGWLWHPHHGFMYLYNPWGDHMFLWTFDMHWLWTTPAWYPYIYRFNDNCWLWYLKGSYAPRWFYEICHGSWRSY